MIKKALLTISMLAFASLTLASGSKALKVDCTIFPEASKCEALINLGEITAEEISFLDKNNCAKGRFDFKLKKSEEGFFGSSIHARITRQKVKKNGKIKDKTVLAGFIMAGDGVTSNLSLSRTINGEGISCNLNY